MTEQRRSTDLCPNKVLGFIFGLLAATAVWAVAWMVVN